ncbi:hypothetical protein GCM10010919_19690 [Alishewanella longhuensis]|uniref:DUF2802 domain-containing protein n=1 Tax=Alishewanella longhuensis TaxID=1091037 RepID=A0ABQ3L0G3_9ALTE|nr:DUF2802 domain-containing protein [Alishewanella longhuensis]GHG69625.1 hypothetical protein GCM10010919_19690 [Alishewanella longhuensis]
MINLSLLPWLLNAIFLILLLVLWLRCRQQWRAQQQSLSLLSSQFEASQQQSSITQTETEELRAGVIGVGQRVLDLQEQQQLLKLQVLQLQEQQDAIALSDPESKIYSRAMKMVELGADLEEIIRECELPRAEAELLYNLHQQKNVK